jgi:NAD(P)-dependent dehydrogenase (short-subunit alcohol dehydrogenase family)
MSAPVAIITGASQGIGAGLVAAYRDAGARGRFGRIDTLINNAGTYIEKPFTEYTADDYLAITAVTLQPLGRVGDVSDVVDAILYLERAGFVTGEALHVDGGQAAGR